MWGIQRGRKAIPKAPPHLVFKSSKKRKFLENATCNYLERDIIEASKETKPNLITEIKMDISKANEILKTIEKRGPFFAFEEVDKNAKAREYFFELQEIDSRIAKQSIAFHNAKNDKEKVDAWRLLLANFDRFKTTLYSLKLELEDDDAHALIGEIWGDCCDLSFDAKKQKPNKTRCLALNNQSNLSWLLIRCCQDSVLNYYQNGWKKARQDVLTNND